MELWEKITGLAERAGLKFVVIGGHAVAAHGYERTTRDADLLVCRDDADRWFQALLATGYSQHHRGTNFIQFNPGAGDPWPLDLMLVNQSTFEKTLAEAELRPYGKTRVPVVSLRHLLALKLFALKNQPSHRVLKDMDDLLNLLQANRVNAKEAWFRELALKYGSLEIYERVAHALG
jgi:hypothetical protein